MGELRAFPPDRRRVLLLLLCALLISVAGVYFVRSLGRPDTGLVGYYPEVIVQEGEVLFLPTAPFSPAVASGLLPLKDRILSIDGSPVSSSWDVLTAVSSIRGFGPFPVTVVREGRQTLTFEVAPAFLPARPEWVFVLLFCAVLVATALVLAVRLPQEPATLPLLLCALLSLVFTCAKPFAYEGALTNGLYNAGNVSSWLLVVFALYFPRPRGARLTRVVLVAGIAALYAVFCLIRVILYLRWAGSGLEQALAQYKLVGQIGNVSDGMAYAVLVALLATAWNHARLPREKSMLQWLLAGSLVALPPYFFFDQLPLILGGPSTQVGLGSLAQFFLSLLPLFLLIGLSRKSLFDFRIFMAHYALYGGLFLLMVALFLVLYLPLKGFIETGYRMSSPLPELFTAAIIVLALAILRGTLERLVARHLPRASQETPPLRGPDVAEQRAFIQGLTRSLQPSARRMSLALARAGTTEGQEAAASMTGLLQRLASASARRPAIHGWFSAHLLAQGAIERTQIRFPSVRFALQGESRERISCSLEEIVQALGAVLENAAEAQEGLPQPVSVRVSEAGSRVLIEIVDHGQGLEIRSMDRLFEPFFTTRPGHQGLGLYFARMMVESNDGAICVLPGDSGGTVVRLSFPGSREEQSMALKERQ
jgi:signal transduction histidine kinase